MLKPVFGVNIFVETMIPLKVLW